MLQLLLSSKCPVEQLETFKIRVINSAHQDGKLERTLVHGVSTG